MLVRRHASRVALYVAALAVAMLKTSGAFAEPPVTVLYAGSLVGLMERSVGPAFKQQTGEEFRGHAGGSQELAKKVKEGDVQGDVFISADPKVNALLTGLNGMSRLLNRRSSSASARQVASLWMQRATRGMRY